MTKGLIHRPFKKISVMIMLWLILPLTLHAEPIKKQDLSIGNAVSITTEYNVGDVAVSDTSICDFMVTESRKEIYLNPRKEGFTTLTVWDAEGKKRDVVPVEISSSDATNLAKQAEGLFGKSNISIEKDGRRIILNGEALSKYELQKAAGFASAHPEVENNVTMSGEILGTVADAVSKAIATPGVTVRDVRGRLLIEGVVYSSAAAKRAIEIAKLYEPDIVDLLEVKDTGRRPGKEKIIRLDAYFMEIKREALRGLGVRWAPGSMPQSESGSESGGGGLFGGMADFGSKMIGFVFNLLPRLKFLHERGEARVLDNATFIVKSGEAADFFSGTQVPYYSGESVTFKDVGVKIHAEPIAAGSDVDLVINATLSSMAANIEAGIDTRNIATSAYVTEGQSVVLANMVSNRDVKTYNKKPANLDTSSALFDLSASKDFQSGRSEFVVFIRPTIVNELTPAEEKLKEYLSMEEDTVGDRSKKEYMEFVDKNGRMPKAKYLPKRKRGNW